MWDKPHAATNQRTLTGLRYRIQALGMHVGKTSMIELSHSLNMVWFPSLSTDVTHPSVHSNANGQIIMPLANSQHINLSHWFTAKGRFHERAENQQTSECSKYHEHISMSVP